ncbi:TetR/AcrR family transcriptional regulator [Vibrio sp. 99-8-1]|uniref:TetR/AcrR family transcriptional regulator n=1 Tax=Vibrio sp. 99-8-1 TaxID=2607602 RepID=UPI001493D2EA|nr:TetR/AcrR family transcriptional regulator [Vibrio sp. 99-8-1]NOI65729.1 TetR/AcrR family transcriptional regulator [Vibrio sp. 99-8-1]
MKTSKQDKIDKIKETFIQVGQRKELTEISIYDIAFEGKMSPSTIYHYFPNMNALILNYLDDIFDSFTRIVKTCANDIKVTHWKDLNRQIQTSLSDYCDENILVMKILYTYHSYHSVREMIVEKDNSLGEEIEKLYRQYFNLPPIPKHFNIFVIALEASDSVYFSRNAGLENESINKEAIIVAESYLSHYLPDYLELLEQ